MMQIGHNGGGKSHEATKIIRVADIFRAPGEIVETAAKHAYAHINPHYPGIRAAVDPSLLSTLCEAVSNLVADQLGQPKRTWQGQAWYSIVTHDLLRGHRLFGLIRALKISRQLG